MKFVKKIASLFLALSMLLCLSTTAFAADPTTGSITVDKAIAGQTYSVYEIFGLESYDTGSGTYSYTITGDSDWYAFVTAGAGKDYVTVKQYGSTNTYYVSWNTAKNTDADKVAFSQAALAYAKQNGIQAAKQETVPEGQTSVTFSDLPLGYYLVDSSLGALCILTTTKPEATVTEKNAEPTVDKEVKEDSTGVWGDDNSADIGQIVEFKTTITVQPGAQNYILHDTMTGLTLDPASIQVQVNDADVDKANYTVTTTGLADRCDFEVAFTDAYVSGLAANTKIVVSYSATVDTDAVIGGNGNPNETWLDYGDDNHSTHDTTKTYTYSFDLVKTKDDDTILTGATFKLYDSKTEGTEILLVKDADGSYRVAVTDEEKAHPVEIEAGHVTIKGLDSDTYYLEETKAPNGYNKLAERIEVKIEDKNNSAVVTGNTYENGGVQVINYAGSQLPSTGGIGTTVFYITGGVLLAGAGLLLVIRKRMNAAKAAK
ncbi:SpaH/EbpB family LPXTG-anchored major pilin [Solibaculum mannosilyticum]|uniref:SpaH/EbpB family LPXTG-anchored major pilin n=1 Tax=Solibaculum mannosilyticum TaxID=2780922 RepID=UPI0007A7DEB5|nr:Cna protein B-type domain protein [Eubacteriaceae bacterium CHKCI005]